MVKAVITDFDGVIRHWNNVKTREVEAHCKLETGTLSRICFSDDLLQPAITGKITYEQWVLVAHDRLKKSYGLSVAEHYIAAWRNNPYEIDHDLISQYKSLFPNADLVLATNATSRLPQELKDANLDRTFDWVFNSSALGVSKPNPQYFKALLMSMGLKPKDVIFIDDQLGNISAAKDLAIQSIHYNSRAQLIEDLMNISLQYSMVEN